MSSTWARYIGATVLLSVLGYNTALTVPGDCIATMWFLVADRTISTTRAACYAHTATLCGRRDGIRDATCAAGAQFVCQG